MSDIVDRIDAAIGCQQCGGPLRDSPSDDFCGERCQEVWHEARADVPHGDEDEKRYGLFQQRYVLGVEFSRPSGRVDYSRIAGYVQARYGTQTRTEWLRR